jgi:Arc/MetJ-type ribon-helix-helix transcriptional regulator
MREILSLSLPAEMAKEIKITAKKRGFASVSEYLKKLVQMDKDMITADQLLVMAEKAEKDYKAGRTIKAASMADLL